MAIFKRKTPKERIQEIYNTPSLYSALQSMETELFVKKTPWANVGEYIAFLDMHYIPHKRIDSKQHIELFAEESKAKLNKHGEFLGVNGDSDWVHDNYVYGVPYIKDNIKNALTKGASLKVSMSSLVLKGGQPLKNALTLRDLGVDVTIRSEDETIRGFSVEQKDEEGKKITYKATCIFQSWSEDLNYAREEGLPQPKEMVENKKYKYAGFITELHGENLIPQQVKEPQAPIVFGFNDYSHNLFNSGKRIEQIINERNMSELLGRQALRRVAY